MSDLVDHQVGGIKIVLNKADLVGHQVGDIKNVLSRENLVDHQVGDIKIVLIKDILNTGRCVQGWYHVHFFSFYDLIMNMTDVF